MTSEGMENATFSDVFSAHRDYVSDKWEHYLAIYEAEIGPLVRARRPVNLLEIGVQNGGSLQVWSKYLPHGSRVVGVDINDRCRELVFPENVTFIHASAADPTIRDLLPDILFDVIIDDGSHLPTDVMRSFAFLSDRLAPGGKYIVEDIETSYDPHYGGGFRSGNSSVEWAKGFVDALNVDHIPIGDRLSAVDGESLKKMGHLLWKVSFYDSVAVFHTLKTPKTRPFGRLFAGEVANVMDPLEWTGHVDAEVFATIGLNEGTYRRIDAALVARVQQLLDREIQIKQTLARLRDHIAGLHEADAALGNLLAE